MNKKLKCAFALFFCAACVFAENEFNLRFAPQFAVPAGSAYFRSGFGGQAVFSWDFFQQQMPAGYGRYVSYGVFAGGSFTGMAAAANGTLTMLEGKMGPAVRWRLTDRWTVGMDAGVGVYNYSLNGASRVKPLAGGGLSAYFHVLPFLSVFGEGAYTWHGFTAAQPIHGISAALGLSLNLGEIVRPQTRLSGERLDQQRIFPVSFAWYEHNRIALVRITNNEKNAISGIRLSFMLERYMNQRYQFAELARLEPGESAEFPVTALFNESMLDLTESTRANTRFTVNYRSLGAEKTMSFSAEMTIYHRNAFAWDDDRRAAAFVSAKDPASAYFASFTAQSAERFLRENPNRFAGVPKNVLLAAALFEALNLYGINYVIDPSSSFIELSENVSALDSLNYPYETLFYRGGDCDDLSILFCSLLETLGIESAFITVPGHIYIAFDSGADAGWKTEGRDLIELEGKRWMPVEITIPRTGFLNAVQVGMRQWNSAAGQGALYPMRRNWEDYRSVSVPGAGERMPAMPDEADIVRAFEKEMGKWK
jgi:hypothetical protein